MKKICCILTFLLLLLAGSAVEAAGPINRDGYFKNIRLAGRVRVVDSFPDLKVQVVSSFPDLKVKTVDSFPDDIGLRGRLYHPVRRQLPGYPYRICGLLPRRVLKGSKIYSHHLLSVI